MRIFVPVLARDCLGDDDDGAEKRNDGVVKGEVSEKRGAGERSSAPETYTLNLFSGLIELCLAIPFS